jgi:two-component system, NarL family, sensor histidine kinase UhpB
MPLRVRLIALVGLVLLVSLAGGGMLVAWHAAGRVQTELLAALDVGANTVRNGFDDLAGASDRAQALRHLVATFDGNRHVRAKLLDAREQPVAASTLLVPTRPAPSWFLRLIRGQPAAIRLPAPPVIEGGGVILLQADPTNETAEVWEGSYDTMLVLAGFAALSALLISAVVNRALRPLEDLSAAFERVGNGNYHSLSPAHGPPELVRLANGFNLMTQRLAAIAAQNHRLNERLLTLQAEERADLARDLHDEIGPLLFAVDMTAATIEHLATNRREVGIPAHARSIHDAVGLMQRRVRAILERLRPLGTIGLATAVGRLVAFWQDRRPGVEFIVTITIDEDRIADDMKETIYRVIQEGVSNAIRHGQPARVEIAVAHDGSDCVRVDLTDDGVGIRVNDPFERGPARFGLIGMRERVMAMAGSLTIRSGHNGNGLTLAASLPCADSSRSHDLDALE